MEGTFTGLKSEMHEAHAVTRGERAAVVRRSDNLKVEGGSYKDVKSETGSLQTVARGERAEVRRRQDNLKMEGSMQFESTSKSASNAISKVNFSRSNRSRDVASSIVIGEDTASVAKAIQQKEMERSVTSSGGGVTTATTIDKTTIRQQTASEQVASTVVQSKSQEATISALNTDKFASSLRESAGVQIGMQKDMSVIGEHQRRVSASNQQQQQMQQRSSVSSARYHEQQSGVVAADAYQRWSSSAQSEYRQQQQQQQQQHWSHQQQSYQVNSIQDLYLIASSVKFLKCLKFQIHMFLFVEKNLKLT